MTKHPDTDREPNHAESSTASLLSELQLYGHRPFQDEPDSRPMPDEGQVGTALADIFDALVSTLTETRMEPDLEDLLWSTVNLFHRAADRVERELDGNEQAQKRSQKDQDGSEIRSVELERLLAEGLTLMERRNAFEAMRDGGRRALRDAHRLRLATAGRIDGEPPRAHLGDDRQPRLPAGQALGRNRGDAATRTQGRLCRRV